MILRLRAARHAAFRLKQHVFEEGGNNRGQLVEQIIKYAGGTVGEPWCVDFVIWCYGHAGSKVVRRGFTRAVRYMSSYANVHVVKHYVRRGHIVRYTFDHTGIFLCFCDRSGKRQRRRNATHIKAIEGNTGARGAVSDGNGSDGVYKKIRPLDYVADFLRVSR